MIGIFWFISPILNRLPEDLFGNKKIGLFWLNYFKCFPHIAAPCHLVHLNSRAWSGRGFFKTPCSLPLGWSANPPCPSNSSLGAVLESVEVWAGEISLGDNGVPPEAVLSWLGQFQSWRRSVSAVLGTYWRCVLCGAHHTMCRHTQAFAFPHDHSSCLAFFAANTCLTKQADTRTSSFSMLLSVAPCLTSRQNSLAGFWKIAPGCWPGGLSMASF